MTIHPNTRHRSPSRPPAVQRLNLKPKSGEAACRRARKHIQKWKAQRMQRKLDGAKEGGFTIGHREVIMADEDSDSCEEMEEPVRTRTAGVIIKHSKGNTDIERGSSDDPIEIDELENDEGDGGAAVYQPSTARGHTLPGNSMRKLPGGSVQNRADMVITAHTTHSSQYYQYIGLYAISSPPILAASLRLGFLFIQKSSVTDLDHEDWSVWMVVEERGEACWKRCKHKDRHPDPALWDKILCLSENTPRWITAKTLQDYAARRRKLEAQCQLELKNFR